MIMTPFDDPAEAPIHQAFTEAYYEALSPGATGVYSNFLEDEGEARVREAYPGLTYQSWRTSRPPMTRRTCST